MSYIYNIITLKYNTLQHDLIYCTFSIFEWGQIKIQPNFNFITSFYKLYMV